MKKTVEITISGRVMTGKSVLAALIAKTLRDHGYSNVVLADEFPHEGGFQNEAPFKDYPITVNTSQEPRRHHG